jgi:WD40 repeat protein
MDGIAGFNSGWICVGSSSGLVAVISCPTPDGERMSLLKTIHTETNASVTALGASGSLLACGNEYGSVHLFDQTSEFEPIMNFGGQGYSVTSLFVQENVIVASFSSGHIRIFRGDVNEMAIEITAHTRVINALAVHPTLKIFLSCGDDQFVNAWSLPDFKSIGSSTTELLFSERIPNRLLTGVSFFPDDKFGVVAYDEDDLIMFSKHS